MTDPVDDELRPLFDIEARVAEVLPDGYARWLTFAMYVVLEEDERKQLARESIAAEKASPSDAPFEQTIERLKAAMPQDEEQLAQRLRDVFAVDPEARVTEEDIANFVRWMRDGPV